MIEDRLRKVTADLINEGYSTKEIVSKLILIQPDKRITPTFVGAVRRSMNKYKTSKLDPKPNGLIEWLKADKLFK